MSNSRYMSRNERDQITVWRYQRGNRNPYIEEEQTTKGQKDKQQSTKHTNETKDRVILTPLNTGVEVRCSGRVRSSCSTSGTRRVNLVTNPVISREWGKDREVFTTSGTYPWSFVTQIFHTGQQSHGGDRKIYTNPWSTTFDANTLTITPPIRFNANEINNI